MVVSKFDRCKNWSPYGKAVVHILRYLDTCGCVFRGDRSQKGLGKKKNRYTSYFQRGYQVKRRSLFWSLGVLLVIEKPALGSAHFGCKGNGLHFEGGAVRACARVRGMYKRAYVRVRTRERGHPGHGELSMRARALTVRVGLHDPARTRTYYRLSRARRSRDCAQTSAMGWLPPGARARATRVRKWSLCRRWGVQRKILIFFFRIVSEIDRNAYTRSDR